MLPGPNSSRRGGADRAATAGGCGWPRGAKVQVSKADRTLRAISPGAGAASLTSHNRSRRHKAWWRRPEHERDDVVADGLAADQGRHHRGAGRLRGLGCDRLVTVRAPGGWSLTGRSGWDALDHGARPSLASLMVAGDNRPYIGSRIAPLTSPAHIPYERTRTSRPRVIFTCAQFVRYDKTILDSNWHTSAIHCGSEPGSW
jgi:hypothetical protein